MKNLIWLIIVFAESQCTLKIKLHLGLHSLQYPQDTFHRNIFLVCAHVCHVCLVNRSPRRPCHPQRQGPRRLPLLPSPKSSPENPQKQRPLPPWPCSVCSKPPSTGKLRGCSSSSSFQPELHPSGGSSSRSSPGTPHRPPPPGFPLNPCTRLWI